jgi:hypothetical protein
MRRYAAILLVLFGCGPQPKPKVCPKVPEPATYCGGGTRFDDTKGTCVAIPMDKCKPGFAWNMTSCAPCPDNTHWYLGTCVANTTLPKADKGGPKWVASTENEPQNLLYAGWDDDAGLDFYFCRATHNKGTHPGYLSKKQCHIGYGGKEVVLNTYEVLTSTAEPRWEWVENGAALPTNAFVGGEENGKGLVVCRVEAGAKLIPGKVVGGKCNYGLNGAELSAPTYEVPVFP